MSTTDGTSATPLPDNTPTGWRCPTCGRGNAPWSSVCPCQGPVYAPPYQPWPTWPMWPVERRRWPWYEVTCDATGSSRDAQAPAPVEMIAEMRRALDLAVDDKRVVVEGAAFAKAQDALFLLSERLAERDAADTEEDAGEG